MIIFIHWSGKPVTNKRKKENLTNLSYEHITNKEDKGESMAMEQGDTSPNIWTTGSPVSVIT